MVNRKWVGAAGVLLVAVLALTGCAGQNDGTPSKPDASLWSPGSRPNPSLGSGWERWEGNGGSGWVAIGPEKVDLEDEYHWVGNDLYVADGTSIQFLGDSAIPERVYFRWIDFEVRFSAVLEQDATVTFDFDDQNVAWFNITVPGNQNFVVTYEDFETDLIYEGCWNGTCFDGKRLSISGSGSDPGSGAGEGPVLTLNLADGEAGAETKIVPEETSVTESSDEETVVTMTADVLFEFGKATLAPGARDQILKVVKEIPQGVAVKIDGHTDSIGGDDINIPLSRDRAKTVADVLRAARSDLTVTDEGHSSSQPVAPNEIEGKDNPAGRALNRRVVLSYPSS
ncbi:MAG: OmpA family protein [Bifidobacteriaceae bacterium]|jgi:outer membrane protein OmpA-like peptidoglycan-associated protein|nr:OmpA family protein [Bifidobacteriaceae bacterium]